MYLSVYFTYVKYEIDGEIYDNAAFGTTKKIAEAGALSQLSEF